MRTHIYKSISDVEPDEWDALVPENRLIATHAYLSAMEQSNINDCQYYYIVLYDGDTIMAHASLYDIRTKLDFFARGLVKRVIEGIRKVWGNFLILRSIECGSPVALGNTICIRETTSQAEALTHIIKATEDLAKKHGVGTMLFRDFYEDDHLKLSDYFCNAGYTMLHNLPSAHMRIQWCSSDAYLASLRSEYRNKARSRIKKMKNAGFSIEFIQDFSHQARNLARLWKNVYDNATEYQRENLQADFFLNVDKHLRKRSAVLMVNGPEGPPVGFLLLFFDNDTLTPLFCGLDYTYSKQYAIYFNLFYAAIDTAIKRNIRNIDFGITTLIPKLELGAEIVPLHIYMKHLNPLLSKAIPWIFDKMTPKANGLSRHVFKTNMRHPETPDETETMVTRKHTHSYRKKLVKNFS